MVAKFNREMIAAINNAQAATTHRNKTIHSKSVSIPAKETFKSIFENAKKGNEMAAVLLDEWQRSCHPKDEKEERMVKSIHRAANQLFDKQID